MQRLFLITLLLLLVGHVKAQRPELNVVSPAGGSAQLESLTLDWTVGEIATLSIQSTSTLITQGFHQPTFKVTAINELEPAIGQIKVYPNPTSDFLEMKLEFDRIRSISMKMTDATGRIVWSAGAEGRLISKSTSIQDLPAGTYFLHFLVDGNDYHQTLKIQKLN